MSVSNYREFDGGYCRADSINTVLEMRKSRAIGKAELRIYFATLEQKEAGDHVPLDVIVNKKRKQRKRMTLGQQERAHERLTGALQAHKEVGEGFAVKLPRKFVRAAARGLFGVSEMITALCYFQRRMPQRSKRKCLLRGEHYGRLSVRIVHQMTGLCFDVIVNAIRRLRAIGLIALVWRPMVEVKRWGRLFVDGVRVSTSFHEPEQSRSSAPSSRLPKSRTVPSQKPNEKDITLPKNSFNRSSSRRENSIAAFAARFCPNFRRHECN